MRDSQACKATSIGKKYRAPFSNHQPFNRRLTLIPLSYKYGQKTIEDLVNLYEKRKLNLSPGFQRKSVWTKSNRKELIKSIFQGYPIPSIFLHKRVDDGEIVYDVLDGKQRIESVLMYIGKIRGMRFSAPILVDQEEFQDCEWRGVQQMSLGHRLMGYEIQTVEVEGEVSDIRELFVGINSTGKRLTTQEIRHAKYYLSPFLKASGSLARKYRQYFETIMSAGQLSRMKEDELVCELLVSLYERRLIHKKRFIDKVLGGESVNKTSLNRACRDFSFILGKIRKVFPRLVETRYTKIVDYYSLFMFLYELSEQGCVLDDPKRNKQAQELLIWLSTGVDQVSEQIRKGKGIKNSQELFRDYLFTVRESTDTLDNRQRRAEILRKVFGGLFERKDDKRIFTPIQRRLLWHSDLEKKCVRCGKSLTWKNFTADHIIAHSRGGKTDLSNAALMCNHCNPQKGAR